MIWLDAQFSPYLAPWIEETFGAQARALRDIGLRDAEDPAIFDEARTQKAIVMTKDSDFVTLLERRGPPRKFCGSPAETPQTIT